jgi:dTDP-glucose 4,6-dehydratase
MKNVLVTGGAGFIGSNFIRLLLSDEQFLGNIINYDALTYSGNPENLIDVQAAHFGRYHFVHGSITDSELLLKSLLEYQVDTVVNFAAESHVDRSILKPGAFLETNVMGTHAIMMSAVEAGRQGLNVRIHHVSTDEVFGSLGLEGLFHETTGYDPKSPYSASKAASDHIVRSYAHTYGLDYTISNCSNNYGPYQFPEKLIPLMILNILQEKSLPVYGKGNNVRDWIHVDDHNRAVIEILRNGRSGESYNVGGHNEWANLDLVRLICKIEAEILNLPTEDVLALITFVPDRPGHDLRYAIDCSKIEGELGWSNRIDFLDGMRKTIEWYLSNDAWVSNVLSGAYQNWMKENYHER